MTVVQGRQMRGRCRSDKLVVTAEQHQERCGEEAGATSWWQRSSGSRRDARKMRERHAGGDGGAAAGEMQARCGIDVPVEMVSWVQPGARATVLQECEGVSEICWVTECTGMCMGVCRRVCGRCQYTGIALTGTEVIGCL